MEFDAQTTQIKYVLKFLDGAKHSFDVNINIRDGLRSDPPFSPAPAWAKLEFNQCPNCPLKPNEVEYCPVALSLVDLAQRVGKTLSYEDVELVVFFKERWVGQRTTSQRAVSSLMGLLIATSGCPRTNFLRPMARFHLPLASEDETLFRIAGMYLLSQYFRLQSGGVFDADLQELVGHYGDLQIVNTSIASRLRESGEITEMNALTLLDLHAQIVPLQIEESMNEIRLLFAEYN